MVRRILTPLFLRFFDHPTTSFYYYFFSGFSMKFLVKNFLLEIQTSVTDSNDFLKKCLRTRLSDRMTCLTRHSCKLQENLLNAKHWKILSVPLLERRPRRPTYIFLSHSLATMTMIRVHLVVVYMMLMFDDDDDDGDDGNALPAREYQTRREGGVKPNPNSNWKQAMTHVSQSSMCIGTFYGSIYSVSFHFHFVQTLCIVKIPIYRKHTNKI